MKAFALLFLGLISCVVHAKDPLACAYSGGYVAIGDKFTLEIDRAPDFDKKTTFRLCDLRDKTFLLVQTYVGGKAKYKKINLDAEQSAKINTLYEMALGADFKDSAVGLDGSSWCLETRRGTNYLKACFWSPTYETQQRRLNGFWDLGAALWELAQFGAANGKLY
jgi:hypothetical protein